MRNMTSSRVLKMYSWNRFLCLQDRKELKRSIEDHSIAEVLRIFFIICQLPPTDRNYMNALWGKLASEILMQDWDNALEDLQRLKEVIDSNVSSILLCSVH